MEEQWCLEEQSARDRILMLHVAKVTFIRLSFLRTKTDVNIRGFAIDPLFVFLRICKHSNVLKIFRYASDQKHVTLWTEWEVGGLMIKSQTRGAKIRSTR